MRSVSVVLPESMCAEMPMLRSRRTSMLDDDEDEDDDEVANKRAVRQAIDSGTLCAQPSDSLARDPHTAPRPGLHPPRAAQNARWLMAAELLNFKETAGSDAEAHYLSHHFLLHSQVRCARFFQTEHFPFTKRRSRC